MNNTIKQELGQDYLNTDSVNKKVNKLTAEMNMLFDQVKALTNRISGIEEKLIDNVICPKRLVDYGFGENEGKE